MPTLMPGDLTRLIFSGFAGAGIGDVADYLYRTEPRYMAALEADIRERGITEAVELLGSCLLVRGHHRAAAAWRAGAAVPAAPYGHSRTPDQTIEHYCWAALRRRYPDELAAWHRQRPRGSPFTSK